MSHQTITFGGGCFWCTEAVFRATRGVIDVEAGYAGGESTTPTYESVCSGATGHAEVVRVTFDTDEISLSKILEIFFLTHDPTTLNRQGADVGTQYRSVIFFSSEEQRLCAEEVMQRIDHERVFDSPLVTELSPLPAFYRAEEYHQQYFEKNPNAGYCQVVIDPKIAAFRKKFADTLKS